MRCGEGADEADREDWPVVHDVRGQVVDPAAGDGFAPRRRRSGIARSTMSAARSTSPAASAWRTAACGIAGPVVPVAGAAVQLGHVAGPLVEQMSLQDVAEQVVVAVPAAVVVERDEEQVLPVQRWQHGPPVGPAGDRVAERAGEPVQDRGLEQEGAHVRRLAVEHLVGEVVDDESVVAGEARDEPGPVVSVLQGQGGELQCGRPSLGARLQSGDVVRHLARGR